MPKPHWQHPDTNTPGCQHTNCTNQATWQWQRHMTNEEVTRHQTQQGPHGEIHHGPGPHHTTVFACQNHAPHPNQL